MNKHVAAFVAALVTTTGALSITAASSVPATAQGPVLELRESFEAVPDGPAPATTVDGSTSVTNHHIVPGAAPHLREGYLTTAVPEEAEFGSYRIAELSDDVARVGAQFAFTPWSTGGGLLCLSIQAGNIATDGPVPVSPVHFIISPEGWGVDTNAEAGTSIEVVTSRAFARPLVADGRTLHEVELVLDREASTLDVALPDGSIVTLTDPNFALPGAFVYVEPFKTGGDPALKSDALVREWWAYTDLEFDLQPDPTPEPTVTPEPTPPSTSPVPVESPAATVTATPTSSPDTSTPSAPVPSQVLPSIPRRVRAERRGARVLVTWRKAVGAERYRVRCGSASRLVTARKATVRTAVHSCRVRAENDAGRSTWVRARVRL